MSEFSTDGHWASTYPTPAQDSITGTSGDDNINALTGADTIIGGAGDDVIHGGKNSDILWGNQGDDSLYGGRGYDELHGGHGDDYLDGGRGLDTLDGGMGDDVLFGGADADLFVFSLGHDRVIDFEDGMDLIDASQFFSNFDQVAAAMVQDGDNVVITAGDNSLTLAMTDIAVIDASDFVF